MIEILIGMWVLVIVSVLFPDLDKEPDRDTILFIADLERNEDHEDWDIIDG